MEPGLLVLPHETVIGGFSDADKRRILEEAPAVRA